MNNILLISLLFFSSSIHAQKRLEKPAIKQVIQNTFRAMKTGDTALFRSCFTHSVIFQSVDTKTNTIKTENFEAFLTSLKKYPKGSLDERIKFKRIYEDGTLASVWTPYQFFYQGKFSHQGVNSFQLVKLGDTWKIQYLIDTRRK